MLDSGVNLVERTMITTLLTQEDSGERRVVGAMGFTLDGEAAVTILANATIMAAGAGSFKAPGFPIQSLTSDGDAMAYRVGGVISGKEWIDFHFTSAENPASCWSQWSRMWDSGVGKMNQVFTAGMTLDSAFAVHTGEEMQSSGPGGPPGIAAPQRMANGLRVRHPKLRTVKKHPVRRLGKVKANKYSARLQV